MKTVGLTFPPAGGQVPAPEPVVPAEQVPAALVEPEEAPADTAKAKVKK